MNEFDHEQAAREDIVARPEVTGEKRKEQGAKEAVKQPPNPSMVEQDTSPDDLELAAGKVFSKTIDELRVSAGMDSDADFARLVSEAMGGLFATLRFMSGSPWVRFAVAGGAIAFSFIPPFMRYMATKSEKEEKKQ